MNPKEQLAQLTHILREIDKLLETAGALAPQIETAYYQLTIAQAEILATAEVQV